MFGSTLKELGKDKYKVIPNGVDTEKFKPIDRNEALNFVGWKNNKKHILFASDPNRKEKNFKLLEDSIKLINDDIEIHYYGSDGNCFCRNSKNYCSNK